MPGGRHEGKNGRAGACSKQPNWLSAAGVVVHWWQTYKGAATGCEAAAHMAGSKLEWPWTPGWMAKAGNCKATVRDTACVGEVVCGYRRKPQHHRWSQARLGCGKAVQSLSSCLHSHVAAVPGKHAACVVVVRGLQARRKVGGGWEVGSELGSLIAWLHCRRATPPDCPSPT
jgi:hypothetical protein